MVPLYLRSQVKVWPSRNSHVIEARSKYTSKYTRPRLVGRGLVPVAMGTTNQWAPVEPGRCAAISAS
jgi:hypothetical protein